MALGVSVVAAADSITATRTTTKLLDALRDHSNAPAWQQIDSRYRPVIRGLAIRLGVNSSDAEEVAQQSLTEFVSAYRDGRYDRTKGRLSSWILGIAHHTTLHMLRRGRSQPVEMNSLPEPVEDSSLRAIWSDERDRSILTRALELLRSESGMDERTMLAFELVALRGVPTAEAAHQCGMSSEQIYVAKSRVTKRLRQLVTQLTDAFEEDV